MTHDKWLTNDTWQMIDKWQIVDKWVYYLQKRQKGYSVKHSVRRQHTSDNTHAHTHTHRILLRWTITSRSRSSRWLRTRYPIAPHHSLSSTWGWWAQSGRVSPSSLWPGRGTSPEYSGIGQAHALKPNCQYMPFSPLEWQWLMDSRQKRQKASVVAPSLSSPVQISWSSRNYITMYCVKHGLVKGSSVPAENRPKILPTLRPECSVFLTLKKTEHSGWNVGKVFIPFLAGIEVPFTVITYVCFKSELITSNNRYTNTE